MSNILKTENIYIMTRTAFNTGKDLIVNFINDSMDITSFEDA